MLVIESGETVGEDTQSSKGEFSRNSFHTREKWGSNHKGPTKYENALDRGEHARILFEEILEFKQVEVYYNYTKDEIIDKMDTL